MPSPTQQLLSRTIYATDGTTTDWNFSFSGGYLDQAHVQAYTESSTGIRTDLTINVSQLIGPYQLRISPALAIGDILVIYRATPRDLPMVDFTDGSGLSETALDVSAKQAVFLAAEIADETGLAGVAAAAGYAQAAEEQALLAAASATIAAGSELAAVSAASAAALSFDDFDDRYLGSKASNPTLDNDGNALLVGAMYWNTALSELRFWSGSVWNTVNLSGTSYALKGANADITSLTTLQSVNGGQLAGFRNLLINGGCQVSQYGTKALVNNTWMYGGADRITVATNSFTTVSGNISQIELPGTVSGFQQSATGVTATGAGTINFGQKIRAANCKHANSKQVTISGKVYQDTGATVACSFALQKANVKNNWSAVTLITSSSLGNIPSGVMTPFAVTVTIGANDATNGLWPSVTFAIGAVTGKTFAIGDFQFELGSVATSFELRETGDEAIRCKSYYETGASGFSGNVLAGNSHFAVCPFKVSKQGTTTVAFSSIAAAGFDGAAPTYSVTADLSTFFAYKTANGNFTSGYFTFLWAASSEL